MENRFGVKDFVLVALLLAVIVMVCLCMVQYDRQWDVIRQVNQKLDDQTRDLAIIRRTLEQSGGVTATGVSATRPAAVTDLSTAFARVLKSRANPDYTEGDALIDTFPSAPGTVTPLVVQELSGTQVQGYVLDSLCTRDPDTLKWVPCLATAWKISDDQLNIDFDLRRGVTFSNGEAFTADDVVFTFNLARNEKLEDPRIRSYLDKLQGVKRTGDYSVRFTFKAPYFKSFEMAAGMGILSQKFYAQFSEKDLNNSTGLLLGSGPYRLADPKSWRPVPGQAIELVRNERYWGVPPAFDRVIWKIIENPSARITSFRNGEIDSYEPIPEQYDNLIADSEVTARTQHFALDVPNAGWMFIGWNEMIDGKPTIFADKRVRQAMTMLIDRQAIVKDIMRGYATVNTSCFSPLSPQSDPAIQPLPFDPPRAMALLAQAGFQLKDGALLDPTGKPVQFPLAYKSTDPVRVHIASFVKDQLARGGIIVDLKPGELSVLVQQLKARSIIAYLGAWSGVLESDPHQTLTTDAIPVGGDNFVHYSNPQFDALVEKARAIVADDPRMSVWHQAHQIIAEDQPYTFLFIQKRLQFMDKRIKGVTATRTGLNPDSEWYVPAAEQKYRQ